VKVKESKTKLAKLLATENIEVRQTNQRTATFDVKNRILTLPMWDFKDTDFLDYVIGHEVSHAKSTPVDLLDRWKEEVGVEYFDALNVTEDIRIERKIQEQFPGLIRSFHNGRKRLLDDVIELPADLSSMKKIDKVNLHAKCGEHIDVPLTDEERDFYDRCYAAETPEEAFDLAKELVSSIKQDQENQQNEDSGDTDDQGEEEDVTDSPSGDGGEGEQQDGEEQDSSTSGEEQEGETDDSAEKQDGDDQDQDGDGSPADADDDQDGEQQDGDSSINDGAGDSGGNLEDFKSDTLKQMEKHLEDNIDENAEGLLYVPSDKRLLNMVHSYEDVKESRREYQELSPWIKERFTPEKRGEFKVFKKKQEKQIQYLITQFERKKAAYQYQRATVSRNGRLNMNSLHRYKIDDDIFQSVSNLANAKDHGMVMVVDYSSSMASYMGEVIEQTLNMVWFCKKVGIPFEVYGFTCGHCANPSDAGKKNELDFSSTNVFELVNSRLKKGEFEEACFRLWATVSGKCYIDQSSIEKMHGTPLDSTIVISAAIIRRFQKTHRIQKTIALFLTDGDSMSCCHSRITVDFGSGVNYRSYGGTTQMFAALRKEVDITLVGYRVGNSYDLSREAWRINDCENLKKSLRKEGFAHAPNALGYDHYFMMNTKKLEIEDDELDLGSDTFDASDKKSVRDLMKKFKNSTKNRKDSRRFLNVFSDIIS
jgi:hypothetical protein